MLNLTEWVHYSETLTCNERLIYTTKSKSLEEYNKFGRIHSFKTGNSVTHGTAAESRSRSKSDAVMAFVLSTASQRNSMLLCQIRLGLGLVSLTLNL